MDHAMHPATDSSSAAASPSENTDTSERRRHKRSRQGDRADDSHQHKRKKSKKHRAADGARDADVNGVKEARPRRNSLSKAARDPRDEPESGRPIAPRIERITEEVETRSPSPVIDFDGLSRPSTMVFPFFTASPFQDQVTLHQVSPSSQLTHPQVAALANGSRRMPRKRKRALLVCPARYAPSSSALVRIPIGRGCSLPLSAMPKPCSSSPRATNRMSEIS